MGNGNTPDAALGDTQRVAIEHACARLVARYAQLVDAGEAVDASALFAPEAELTMHTGQVFRGRDAIRARLAGQPRDQVTRHLVSGTVIEAIDSARATGRCYLQLYRAPVAEPVIDERSLLLLGQYDDEFELRDGDWCFVRRRLSAALRRREAGR